MVFNILMLFVLLEIRQYSQLAFSQLQDIEKMQRLEKQVLKQIKLDYLKSLNEIPMKAKTKGYQSKEVEDV